MADDASVLSGNNIDSSDNVSVPNVPAQDTSAPPAPPDMGNATPGTQPTNFNTAPLAPADASAASSAAAPPAPPQSAGQPSVWKNLVMGALYGMASGAQVRGRNSAGAAAGAGFTGAISAQDRQQQQQVQQQQLQMESVKAADSHIAAMHAARASDNADEEAKLNIADHQAKTQESLEEMGIAPKLTISGDNPADIHAQAAGALTTLANGQPGGKIPQVTTTNSPATSGNDTHTIHVYSVGPQDADKNSTLQVINANRAYNNLPPIQTQADLQVAGGQQHPGNWRAGVAEMANDSTKNLYAIPPVDKDAGKNQATLNNLKQQLSTYEDHKDANGKSDASPTLIKSLQARIDAFNSTSENTRSGQASDANKTTLQEAPAKASSAGQVAAAEAKAKLPYELAKSRADQAIKDGDPNAAGKLLAAGDVAPSQIISARNPAFAQQAFAAAKAADPNWNAQTAEGWYKTASQPNNVAFFGSAKSLTDPGGTLEQLQTQYNKLPNGKLPAYNKLADWKAAAAGSGATAGFAQTALGAADDYAKVMGGGQGSDSAREELLTAFSRSSSPAQMEAAISAAHGAVNSQISSRIGNNPVMAKMYTNTQGGNAAQNNPTQSVGHKSGDIITQNGKNFVVSSVDANGKVTGANAQ
jgi:hypothetical protein